MNIDHRNPEATGLRRLFQEQWDYLTQLLDQFQVQQERTQQQRAVELETLEAVVEGTNTRMRLVGNYKKRLRGSVRALLDYVKGLVERLPLPIDASPGRFNTDPQLNAFFVNKAHVTDVFGRSRELRKFFLAPQNNQLTRAHTILFIAKKEKNILGMGMVGDTIMRDVKQTTVSFTDHQVEAPCASEEEVKKALKRLLFDSFVSYVKYYFIRNQVEDAEKSHEADNRLEEGSEASSPDLKNPEIYLRELIKLLENPQDLLKLEKNVIRVNKMGVKVPKGGRESANEISLHEIGLGKTANQIVILVTYPRDEMPATRDLLEEASAFLRPL